METAVIFGGSGFLGSYLAEELVLAGFRVVIADLKPGPYFISGTQTFLQTDINSSEQVRKAIPSGTAYVFNLAGVADIDEACHSPAKTIQNNVIGNIHILEACRDSKVRRFLFASSAYAASIKGSFYGISKLTSEKIVEEFRKNCGLNFTILRFGSLYGERADERNGIYRLIQQAIKQKKITHRGTGEEVREYIHARDAARLSVKALAVEFEDSHLLFTGIERIKQKDVLAMIAEILDDQVQIEFTNEEYKGHYRVTPYSFQPTIARKMVSNPYIDFGQGLIDCMKEIHSTSQNPLN